METGLVRKRVVEALQARRAQDQQRRSRNADAERDFTTFLDLVAAPLARQVAGALKAEGYSLTVFTPGRGLRIALEKGRDDFVDLLLDTEGDRPQVIGRISYTRGSRTVVEDAVVKDGTGPEALTEEIVLEFLLRALAPLLSR
jgi:hypothetical protein